MGALKKQHSYRFLTPPAFFMNKIAPLIKEYNLYRDTVFEHSFLPDRPSRRHFLSHKFPIETAFNLDIPAFRVAHPYNLYWATVYEIKKKEFFSTITFQDFMKGTEDYLEVVRQKILTSLL